MKSVKLNQVKKSKNAYQKIATTAHLLETTAHHLAHTKRHLDSTKKDKTSKERKFDQEHLETHLNGAIEHVQKLMVHFKSNYPREGRELKTLENTIAHSQQLDPNTQAKIKGIADALRK